MLTMHEIRTHYQFTDGDAELLTALAPLAEKSADPLMTEFFDFLLVMPETASIVREEGRYERLVSIHRDWFLALFSGTYGNTYLLMLQRIGQAHVHAGLSTHYVNASMSLVRKFVLNMIQQNFDDRDERKRYRDAVEKLLDINLDVMTASFREEEMKRVFVSERIESKLIDVAERFTYGLNLVLILALAGVSIAVVGLFLWDLVQIFHGDVEKGILGALGTLLIIWMMIELMDNEIRNLKGGRFNILVFIGVILVALIREILISTLRHDALETQVFLAGTLLILGVVYYLVSKSQQNV